MPRAEGRGAQRKKSSSFFREQNNQRRVSGLLMLAQQKVASRRVVRICRQLISSPTLGEESLADLPIKELKKRLKDRGIRHNDCLTSHLV